jgi:hypothetical protein
MQPMATDRRLHLAVKHGWSRLLGAARPRYRFRRRRGDRVPGIAAAVASPPTAIDPVALTVLAVNRLWPATLRTAANGKPLTVTVPNARIGEIFSAALGEMQKARTTDRLIDIVIAGDTADAKSAAKRA